MSRRSQEEPAQKAVEPGASPLVRVDRLDHVHLYVADRPAAVAWYGRILGLRLYGRWREEDPTPDHPVFLAPGGGGDHVVSLFVGERPRGGDRTVAFHVAADAFLGFARRLPDPEVLALDGSPLTAAGAHDYGMALTFNFLDPAGNHLELVTYEHEAARAGLAALA